MRDEVTEAAEAVLARATEERMGDAEEVGKLLRAGIKRVKAGRYAEGRAVLESLAAAFQTEEDIFGCGSFGKGAVRRALGDTSKAARAYLAAVYATTPVSERAKALRKAVGEVAFAWDECVTPLADVQAHLGPSLPDADVFIPSWIALLKDEAREAEEGRATESPIFNEQRLNEAATVGGGREGLKRLAFEERSIDGAWEWAFGPYRSGHWDEAVATFEEAAEALPEERGVFLDAAACAAQRLETGVALAKLETAWRRAPSQNRILRWVFAQTPAPEVLRERALAATSLKFDGDGTYGLHVSTLALLHVIAGDVDAGLALIETEKDSTDDTLLGIGVQLALGPKAAPERSACRTLTQQNTYPRSDSPILQLLVDDLVEVTVFDALRRSGAFERVARARALEVLEARAVREAARVAKWERPRGHAATPKLVDLVMACVELGTKRAENTEASGPWFETIVGAFSAERHATFVAELREQAAAAAGRGKSKRA